MATGHGEAVIDQGEGGVVGDLGGEAGRRRGRHGEGWRSVGDGQMCGGCWWWWIRLGGGGNGDRHKGVHGHEEASPRKRGAVQHEEGMQQTKGGRSLGSGHAQTGLRLGMMQGQRLDKAFHGGSCLLERRWRRDRGHRAGRSAMEMQGKQREAAVARGGWWMRLPEAAMEGEEASAYVGGDGRWQQWRVFVEDDNGCQVRLECGF